MDYYAAPTMRYYRRGVDQNTNIWAYDLQTAINKAGPGDHVILLPGRYHLPVTIAQSGRNGAPITLRAQSLGTAVLEGGQRADAGRQGELKPLDNDFAMIRVFFADHIVLEGLHFENCWPTGIYMRCARHITVRNCSGVGGRFFAYARQQRARPTHHLTFEDCRWVQDPDHDMWEGRFEWNDVKGQGNFDATYFNGAFFGSFDIAGKVIVRRCDVRHAFNVIRMDMRADRDDIAPGPEMDRNRDVAIYDNRFSYIRDNAIEPEKGAQNWRVFNNRFFAVHASVSLDLVALRDVLCVGNTVLNTHRPGFFKPDGSEAQSGQGGRIFKFLRPSDDIPAPRRGLWSLFNSVQTRTSYSKKGVTQDWTDAFTLLGLYAAEHPENPGAPRAAFKDMSWNAGTRILDMVSNDATFPEAYVHEGGDVSGWRIAEVFAPPVFELAPGENPLDADLGGWDGVLDPTEAARAHVVTQTHTITLATGEEYTVPAGVPLGACDVAELGLEHWRDPWPDAAALVG